MRRGDAEARMTRRLRNCVKTGSSNGGGGGGGGMGPRVAVIGAGVWAASSYDGGGSLGRSFSLLLLILYDSFTVQYGLANLKARFRALIF